MGNHKLFFKDLKHIRNSLNQADLLAQKIHQDEKALVELLYEIDREQFYLRYGFKSLSGYCRYWLRFSKTQTQRIVTQVRRLDPEMKSDT